MQNILIIHKFIFWTINWFFYILTPNRFWNTKVNKRPEKNWSCTKYSIKSFLIIAFFCQKEYDKLREAKSKVNDFMRRIEEKPFQKLRSNFTDWERYVPCDEFAMAVVINESAVVTEFKEVYATVEVKGEYTYGMMVVDWRRMLKRPNNVRLVTKIDNEKFMKMLYRPIHWKWPSRRFKDL